MRNTIILILNCILITTLSSQNQSSLDSLKFWGDAMISLKDKKHRVWAEEAFLSCFKREIQSASDSSKLEFHPAVVHITSPDGRFKMYSWQVEHAASEFLYYTCILPKSGDVLLLKSTQRNLRKINFEEFSDKNWYGALYYHIFPGDFEGHYLLLGFSISPDGTKHRIVEPFQIKDGKPRFGAPLFKKQVDEEEVTVHRLVLSYSPSANAVFEFDPATKQIMQDHITSFIDPKSGEQLEVPDGTYEAYEWKNGAYKHIPYVKAQIMETAPIEKPVLGQGNKDLFGRPKSH